MTQEPFTDPYKGPVVTGDEDPYPAYPRDDLALQPVITESGSSSTSEASTTDVAKDQAAQVGQNAADAGKHVAGVAKDQAANVAGEAKSQARNLAEQARSEVQDQAHTQKQRVAEGLRSIGEELGSMAEGSQQKGAASDLARQASQVAHDAASWLEDRDPSALLDEVRSFARRRPGAFLGIALGAGVLAGRFTRGITASGDDDTTVQATQPSSFSTGSTGSAGSTGEAYSSSYPASDYVDPDLTALDYPVSGRTTSQEIR